MTALSVQPPFPILTDIDGQPLDDGFIWIGVANNDPIANPITVYWDAALTVTATQPIRTRGGYPMNAGVVGRLYVNSDYSIQVQNRTGSVIYSAPVQTERFGNLVSVVPLIDDIASLRTQIWPSGRPAVVQLTKNYVLGDGGGFFYWDAASTATDDGGTIIKETATVTGRWERQFVGPISVTWFGAIGDNSTNNTTAIQTAINTALSSNVGLVFFPGGTYLTNKLTMVRNVTLIGAGQKVTFIKLRNNQNTNLIETQDATTLLATGLTPAGARSAGAGNWSIRDLTLDGNRANNTTGNVLAFWGYRVAMQNVTIREAAENGIDSGWADYWDPTIEPVFPSMESSFFNVLIDTCGKYGWRSAGPHDFSSYNVIIVDCSLSADNIYSGLLTRLFTFDTTPPTYVSTALMTGQFNTLHIWQRGATTQRMRYCLEDRSGNLGFTNTHLEGARTANALLLANDTYFDETCWFYSVWSDGIGSPEQNVLLAGVRNGVRGVLQVPGGGRPDCEGVQIGFTDGITFTAENCIVDVWAVGQNEGVINFHASAGGNIVYARGTSTIGWTGTINVNDEIDIDITGATTNARLVQNGAYSGTLVATGTTQGTALQLTDLSDSYAVNSASVLDNGVRLPAARPGAFKSIINVGTQDLYVYASTGETLNGGGALLIAANNRAIFFSWAAANWSSVIN